jgi:hypothetical protein
MKGFGNMRTLPGNFISSFLSQKWIGFGLVFAVVFAFYFWTAHPTIGQYFDRRIFDPPPGSRADYYNAQVKAFLAGRTSLLEEPRPELLALDDPYDPTKNHQRDAQGPYCLHDASLYKGKYYLYFGVTPAVTLFAPYMLLTGECLPPSIAATLFALAGLLFTALLFNFLADLFFPSLGLGTRLTLVLALGCCNCAPFLLRSPVFYEIAILSAYCFTMAGLYFLARGCLEGDFRIRYVATGSLSLGLAIGCRPHMLLVGLIAFSTAGIWLLGQVRRKSLSVREFLGRVAALLGPWVLCVGLLAAYNYERFDSPMEFGARYALVGGSVRIKDRQMLDLHRLKTDLSCYLFALPRLDPKFPYVSLELPDLPSEIPDRFLGFTPIGGVLICMPFLAFLLLSPITLYRLWNRGQYNLFAAMIVLLCSGIAMLLFVSCFSAAMRYVVDFVNLLLVSALLVLLEFEQSFRNRALLKWCLRITAAICLVISCLFNLGVSIVGQRNVPADLAVRDRLQAVFPEIPFLK